MVIVVSLVIMAVAGSFFSPVKVIDSCTTFHRQVLLVQEVFVGMASVEHLICLMELIDLVQCG